MPCSALSEVFLPYLLSGDRTASRDYIQQQISSLNDASLIYKDLLWPAMEKIERLFRADRINAATEHMATRITRSLADQVQQHLKQEEPNGKRVVITCAEGEPEELGAQMTADLFESQGWSVYFLGGGVPNDEILTLVGQLLPDLLLIFGTQPGGVPGVRKLVDLIREIDVNPKMNIMVSGGVFNRADGLFREVNADLFAKSAAESLDLAEKAEPRVPLAKVNGSPKKRRRRRRAALVPVGCA